MVEMAHKKTCCP